MEDEEGFWSKLFRSIKPRYFFMVGLPLLFYFAAIWHLLGVLVPLLFLAIWLSLSNQDTKNNSIQDYQLRTGIDLDDFALRLREVESNNDISQMLELPPPQPTHSEIFANCADDLDDIKIAAGAASGALSEKLNTIDENIAKIMREIEADSIQFSQTSRLFTYYVPEIVNLLRARGGLSKRGNKAKIAEIDEMLSRLAIISEEFLNKLSETDSRALDVDLKLLDQSIAQDMTFNEISMGTKAKDKV